jgi:hypothetical protein
MALFFPWPMLAATITAQIAWQYWLHLVLWPETPLMELVFVTPSLHRVHHTKHHDRLGKDYGAIFSLWDRLFGTFEPEFLEGKGGREQLCYGVIPALNTWDPTWIQFHHWHRMLVEQTQWDSWAAPFRHWTPPGGKCPKLGSRLNPNEKYSAHPTSLTWSCYAGLEGSLLIVACAASVHAESLWDSSGIQMFLGCGASVADLIVGVLALALALWSGSCVAQLFTGESEAALRMEVIRQVVLFAGIADYIGLSFTYLATYACLRAVGILALWNAMPKTVSTRSEVCFESEAEEALQHYITHGSKELT